MQFNLDFSEYKNIKLKRQTITIIPSKNLYVVSRITTRNNASHADVSVLKANITKGQLNYETKTLISKTEK